MLLGVLVFLLMCISFIYSLVKWSNYKKSLENLLLLHCSSALVATVIAIFHIILVNSTFKFNVQSIALVSMIGATITGIPLKIVFKNKVDYVKIIWPFHIAFAMAFIISIILHILMAIVM